MKGGIERIIVSRVPFPSLHYDIVTGHLISVLKED